VYSGIDGESHFQDLTPDQLAEIVNHRGEGPINLGRRPANYFSNYHNAPRRQYVVTLAGRAELEVADGSKRQFGPGDVLVAEDLIGHGHILRHLGNEPRISLSVPLAD
jgi:hypothetical protein